VPVGECVCHKHKLFRTLFYFTTCFSIFSADKAFAVSGCWKYGSLTFPVIVLPLFYVSTLLLRVAVTSLYISVFLCNGSEVFRTACTAALCNFNLCLYCFISLLCSDMYSEQSLCRNMVVEIVGRNKSQSCETFSNTTVWSDSRLVKLMFILSYHRCWCFVLSLLLRRWLDEQHFSWALLHYIFHGPTAYNKFSCL